MPRTSRLVALCLGLSPLLALAACQARKADAPRNTQAQAVAKVETGQAHMLRAETGDYTFSYAWPDAAGAIPALRRELAADEESARQALERNATKGRERATRDHMPFAPFSHRQEWQVAADLPGWLSLTSLTGRQDGSGHPGYAYSAVLWDKTAGRRRALLDLFADKAALDGAIRAPFCAALQAQRAHKRSGQASLGSDSRFDACPDPLAQVVAPAATSGPRFDHLVVLIAPLVAGPYGEGTYEIALPVTPAVLAALRPDRRQAFALP